jgi:hypothetical protein
MKFRNKVGFKRLRRNKSWEKLQLEKSCLLLVHTVKNIQFATVKSPSDVCKLTNTIHLFHHLNTDDSSKFSTHRATQSDVKIRWKIEIVYSFQINKLKNCLKNIKHSFWHLGASCFCNGFLIEQQHKLCWRLSNDLSPYQGTVVVAIVW